MLLEQQKEPLGQSEATLYSMFHKVIGWLLNGPLAPTSPWVWIVLAFHLNHFLSSMDSDSSHGLGPREPAATSTLHLHKAGELLCPT